MSVPLRLGYKVFGSSSGAKSPVLILHGMFGSCNNWRSLGKKIAFGLDTTVYTLDARNHGSSGHVSQMDYNSMSHDTVQFCKDHSLERVSLIGHSMGGKTAMAVALTNPDLIDKLVVVDVSPAPAPGTGETVDIVEALKSVDLSAINSRREADSMMQSSIPESRIMKYLSIRDFLLTNLVRAPSTDKWAWRFNLDAIENSMHTLKGFPQGITTNCFKGNTLFVGGERSNYITNDSLKDIKKLFPQAQVTHIADAGHWVHHDNPESFLVTVNNFLLQ